jgi:hypothetical protein
MRLNVCNVWVIERCRGRRLLFEAAHSILVSGHFRGENLQRHFAMEPRVFRQINFTHAAFADLGDDAVMSDDRVGGYTFAQILAALLECVALSNGVPAYSDKTM